MSNRLTIMAAVLLGLFLGLPVPVSVGAQGGDAVYRSLRLQIPLERRYMEPQGLQDAATDLLTADFSTMSSSYQTIMSGSVTVGVAGDAVLVHVTGQIGWMGAALYVLGQDDTGDELWRIDDPTDPGAAVLEGDFPSGLTAPEGIASQGGALYVVNSVTPDELWRIDDPTDPGAAVLEGDFPSGLTSPSGITSQGGALYVVNSVTPDELWRIDDPTDPGAAVLEGDFPSGLTAPTGITSHGGALYVVDLGGRELWRIDDPTNPGSAVLQGTFPSGLTVPTGITSHDGALYVLDDTGDELWRIDDPTDPGAAVLEGDFPSGLTSPKGIVGIGTAPCMIRLARGTTEIEGFDLDEGRILFDATFTDSPPVGTHTYSLQMRTQDPNTLCTAYRGGGTVPMPSLLVQSFYAGSIP